MLTGALVPAEARIMQKEEHEKARFAHLGNCCGIRLVEQRDKIGKFLTLS